MCVHYCLPVALDSVCLIFFTSMLFLKSLLAVARPLRSLRSLRQALHFMLHSTHIYMYIYTCFAAAMLISRRSRYMLRVNTMCSVFFHLFYVSSPLSTSALRFYTRISLQFQLLLQLCMASLSSEYGHSTIYKYIYTHIFSVLSISLFAVSLSFLFAYCVCVLLFPFQTSFVSQLLPSSSPHLCRSLETLTYTLRPLAHHHHRLHFSIFTVCRCCLWSYAAAALFIVAMLFIIKFCLLPGCSWPLQHNLFLPLLFNITAIGSVCSCRISSIILWCCWCYLFSSNFSCASIFRYGHFSFFFPPSSVLVCVSIQLSTWA